MTYEIKGGQLPVVICKLQPGESVFTESGGMSWMSMDIQMTTNMPGGLFGGIARKFSGESLFMNTYTCQGNEGKIAFASSFPGQILPFLLQPGQSLICQKRSFLAGQSTVKLEACFAKRFGAGMFGGEGFVLQRVTGPGIVFLEIDGSAIEETLQPGQKLKVDTGHVAVMTPDVQYGITMVKGFTNILFGGEGLFLVELTGPGKVWLQTLTAENVAKSVIPFIPKSN